ncbi:FAD-dependent oxidoreductase [bacterium]|nr:FAD-dependent oxidoreductase [bacterium]
MSKHETLWIEAQDFEEKGGWILDSQYVHLMGCPYLIAAGAGQPVPDAHTRVALPRQSNWHLWVRNRNWAREHAPGKFQILLNGKTLDKTFGAADTPSWTWRKAGSFDLSDTIEIALHDLTGFYGRCAALIITTDPDYTPPQELDAFRDERRRLRNIPPEPQFAGDFDLIVAGTGFAGAAAAIQAARLGARVALISDRPLLGGNGSNELGIGLSSAAARQPNAREGGINEEIRRLRDRHKSFRYTEALDRLTEQEPNITVFLNEHVCHVDKQAPLRISGIIAENIFTGRLSRFTGRFFVDGTGDGWLGFYAGAKYRFGREARREFNESLAPETPDRVTMTGCLIGNPGGPRYEDAGKPVPYEKPAWAPKFPSEEEFGRVILSPESAPWWMEHSGDFDDMWQGEEARDELIKIAFAYWDFIKNIWSGRKQAENLVFKRLSILNARREGRRLVGDHILSQNDVEQALYFPDTVAYAGWPLDIHHPKGIFSGKEGPFMSNAHVPLNFIPFRTLYSANIENLFLAGRDMSVTHVALGTVRVQATLCICGQAIGAAAALCLKHHTTPRGIYESHIRELQQLLLKHDQYIPRVHNEDPADLARCAKATASSVSDQEVFNLERGYRAELMPLDVPRATMFPRDVQPQIDSLYIQLASDREDPVEITLHVRQARDPEDYKSQEDIAAPTAVIPPKSESWVEFKVNRNVDVRYVWVWLAPIEGLSWRRIESAALDHSIAIGGDDSGWQHLKGIQQHPVRMEKPLEVKAHCGPENIINGYGRIESPLDYAWVSDPNQPMPQWVQLDFESPVDINTVYLTFDTDMNNPPHVFPQIDFVPKCVRDYTLACFDGHKWITVAQIRENFMRRRIHRFTAITAARLRLTVQATNGDPCARVFEIRAYRE